MKVLKTVLLLTLTSLVISCGVDSKNNETKTYVTTKTFEDSNGQIENGDGAIASKLTKVALKIEGMTCEIGCARTIQSKLSKADGVKLAEISFEKKSGIVEFDSSKITENEIVEIVEAVAGGDLYDVVEVRKTE
ncbi:heavy-metal-associated domain-containing protein [Aureibaculum marinum]|uniref:Heavy-metal-associated domain-containing protein n=1 Tax=Aureibaculum marinum TaxID=2487930 RepID=A0A3N4P1S5_9FLAO|nr:heavy-metal-associated domain-containing protein [Aureibaculum marinum]